MHAVFGICNGPRPSSTLFIHSHSAVSPDIVSLSSDLHVLTIIVSNVAPTEFFTRSTPHLLE